MKIYEKVIVDIASGETLESHSFEYDGEVLLAKPSKAKASESAAGKIVGDLYGRGPLRGRLEGILQPAESDPYFQRTLQQGTQQVRGGFGARGLAGGGIAQRAENDFIQDALLKRDESKANQAIQILGTGSSSPSVIPGQSGSGFLGLK